MDIKNKLWKEKKIMRGTEKERCGRKMAIKNTKNEKESQLAKQYEKWRMEK